MAKPWTAESERAWEKKVNARIAKDIAKNEKRDEGGGYIYFIEGAGLIKIGYSIDPEMRMKGLAVASPVPLVSLGYIPGSRALERRLHKKFTAIRAHGEWFEATDELRQYIAKVTDV